MTARANNAYPKPILAFRLLAPGKALLNKKIATTMPKAT